MHVVYSQQEPPERYAHSIFLAGPTPRSAEVPSWRPHAIALLAERGYAGVVFVPEDEHGEWRHDYTDQVEWEERCLNRADCIVFWVPRALDAMPAFTTNIEWGAWCASGKVVLGYPEHAPKMRYLHHYAEVHRVPIAHDLDETLGLALERLEVPEVEAMREAGERDVPLYIWRSAPFQSWYKALKGAGNRLDGARVAWTFRGGPGRRFVIFAALHAKVWIAAEGRWKASEVVIWRPDISAVVAFVRAETLADTSVLMVREYRVASSTTDGFVHELPGGSTFEGDESPLETAATELVEETSLAVDPSRLFALGSRQLAATMSAHKAAVYGLELERDELDALRGRTDSIQGDQSSERTYIEIRRFGDLMRDPDVDWSNLGMICAALDQAGLVK